MRSVFLNHGREAPALPSVSKSAVAVLLASTMLAGCVTKPPQIRYDADVPPLPAMPAPAVPDGKPKPLSRRPAGR